MKRVNRFLKSSLKKLVELPSDWNTRLDKTQYAINNTRHSAIKNTPNKLLLGYNNRNNSDRILTELIRQWADIDDNADREPNYKTAEETTNLLREYNKQYYDSKYAKPIKYKVNEYVMIKDLHIKPGQSAKLKPI